MKKIGLSGLILAGGLSLFNNQSFAAEAPLWDAPSEPSKYQQIDPKKDVLAPIRNEMQKKKHIAQRGASFGKLAYWAYGCMDAGYALKKYNEEQGNISQHYEIIFTDDHWRTEMDMHWNQKTMHELRWYSLKVGDELETPEVLTDKNGRTWKYNPIIPPELIDERIRIIKGEEPTSRTSDFQNPFGRRYGGGLIITR